MGKGPGFYSEIGKKTKGTVHRDSGRDPLFIDLRATLQVVGEINACDVSCHTRLPRGAAAAAVERDRRRLRVADLLKR